MYIQCIFYKILYYSDVAMSMRNTHFTSASRHVTYLQVSEPLHKLNALIVLAANKRVLGNLQIQMIER